ncbi:hypothetical protein ACQEUU_37555 [Nonomuraea sp. CA-218870]|uniref:hypothetical protein n=1 Tax=Nonomuraea sp. CA-218870 TaxID=3239998 RepID=UPI003D8CEFFE
MGNAASPGAIPEGTDLQARAQAIVDDQLADAREQYADRIDSIRSRTGATDQARRVGLARVVDTAKQRQAQLRERALYGVEETRFVLQSRLYGSGGRTPNNLEAERRRQAQLDAARLDDPREAAHAYKIAHRNGDKIQCQAIFERASTLQSAPLGGKVWTPIVNEYVRHNPQAAEDLAKLRSLPDLNNPRTRMAFEAQFIVPVPDELAGLSDGQIEQLAASEMAD